MSESISFESLVREAYIDPIKSVLAVDDEYLSLDSFLQNQVEKDQADVGRQYKVLQLARSKNWLVDILQGPEPDNKERILKRLHQSDLLLLDYHLDKVQPDDPSTALSFLNSLNVNHHFNLIVVYTNEDDLQKVKNEIFTRLAPAAILDDYKPSQEANELVRDWEENGDLDLGELSDVVKSSDIIHLFSLGRELDSDAHSDYLELILEPTWNNVKPAEIQKSTLIDIYWLAAKKAVYRIKESGEFQGQSGISVSKNIEPGWVKTERLFISIVSKQQVEPDHVVESLEAALCDWSPTSHRLLLSKIKNQLDDHGQTFENHVLKCEHTTAGWLKQFAEIEEGRELTLKRLMEGLTNALADNSNIDEFANKLKARISQDGLPKVVESETSSRVDLTRDKLRIMKCLNAHICSTPPTGRHLVPGHIIEWGQEYWICLTPACDLVPEQQGKNWQSNLGTYIPAKFAKLHPHEVYFKDVAEHNLVGRLNKEIKKKLHILFTLDDEVKGFSILKTKDSAPHWEQCFLGNEGHLRKTDDSLLINICRNYYSSKEEKVITEEKKCRVVGQLRYEYALNLIGYLGENLTRIGLDFTEG